MQSGEPAHSTPVVVTNKDTVYPISVSISSVDGKKPLTVDFSIKAGKTIVRPVRSSWNFGDGTRIEEVKEVPSHIYVDPGMYFPSVTILFSNGHTEIFSLPQIVVYGEAGTVAPTSTPTPKATATPRPTLLPTVA